jgi:hypothetical protein
MERRETSKEEKRERKPHATNPLTKLPSSFLRVFVKEKTKRERRAGKSLTDRRPGAWWRMPGF